MTGWLIGILAAGPIGCAAKHLAWQTASAANTVMDIHQQIILQNLAQMSACPQTLPGHMRIANGVVQVNHNAGLGRSGGLTEMTNGKHGLDRFGPSTQVSVSQQWGSDAVANPADVKLLQDLYRIALGHTPLPDPPSLWGDRSSGSGAPSSGSGDGSADSDRAKGSDRAVSLERKEQLMASVPPPGWVHFGSRRDVPSNAVAVAHDGKRYAWVNADGVGDFSRMTLAVLGVIKDTPSSPNSGLAVTGGGG